MVCGNVSGGQNIILLTTRYIMALMDFLQREALTKHENSPLKNGPLLETLCDCEYFI